jgi:hypothetical protein
MVAAKSGDMRAADILLRRLWPERKDRPVLLDLPAIKATSDIVAPLGAVSAAVAAGDLSPKEGTAIAAILEGQRRAAGWRGWRLSPVFGRRCRSSSSVSSRLRLTVPSRPATRPLLTAGCGNGSRMSRKKLS